MSTRTIYIVMGTCGEYSDRSEWPVAAYDSEAMAQEHVKRATETAVAVQPALQAARDEWEGEGEYPTAKGRNPYDPEPGADYGDTTYYLSKTEMRTELPAGN